MSANKALAAVILAYASIVILAAPIPQLAGEGAACDSILSSTDNGVGFGIENAEDGVAKLFPRQLAGEGAACNSILSSTDNGVGFGVENAENNLAGNIANAPKANPFRRQLDKIATGTQNLGAAVGLGDLTAPTTTGLEGIDGTTTTTAAETGAEVGGVEEGTLEAIGSAVP